MKLSMTTLINFNIGKREAINSRTLLHDNPGYRSLINQKKLLSELLVLSHNAKNWKSYQITYDRSILLAILSFKDLKFRHQYSKWIYTNYSDSAANHKMVQRNESRILFKWAKAFNQHHKHLKLIKVLPRVDSSHLYAYLLLIPFSAKDKLSFDLKTALVNEYRTKYYDQALYKFESDAGHVLSTIAQKVFHQCIPDGDLHFVNRINQFITLKLKPVNHRSLTTRKSINTKPQPSSKASLLNITSASVPLLPAPSATSDLSLSSSVETAELGSAISLISNPVTSKPSSTSSMASLISRNTSLIKYVQNYPNKETNSQSASTSSSNNYKFQSFMASNYTKSKSVNKTVNKQKKSTKRSSNKSNNVLNTLRKNKGYITLIIIISFIIIALLIIVFPLFKF